MRCTDLNLKYFQISQNWLADYWLVYFAINEKLFFLNGNIQNLKT